MPCFLPSFMQGPFDDLVRSRMPLAGGYAKGDKVVSQINLSHHTGTVKVGDVGTVEGPCNNAALPTPDRRLFCSFPNLSNVNMTTSQIKGVPLAGGYAKGDKVVSQINPFPFPFVAAFVLGCFRRPTCSCSSSSSASLAFLATSFPPVFFSVMALRLIFIRMLNSISRQRPPLPLTYLLLISSNPPMSRWSHLPAWPKTS